MCTILGFKNVGLCLHATWLQAVFPVWMGCVHDLRYGMGPVKYKIIECVSV